ncbi:MAG: DUF5916 domain-containing protein [Bacteroidales bacterium]|nr:DUF5916 domain-containing protein [Bacteroidales bacterium]
MIKRILLVGAVYILCIYSGETKPLKGIPDNKRTIGAHRISERITIDGVLDEDAWSKAQVAKDFFQYEPFNGSYPSENTEVRVLYDDASIYIGASLYDEEPENIYRELGKRDNSDNLKSDVFSVLISPYNDGINYLEFIVSASGVQTDIRRTGNRSDRSWDGVWESRVSITSEGWFVEMRIPYSALRFSSKVQESWGVNFRRLIKRYNEWNSWNPIDNSISGIVNQSGELSGIYNIDTPVRLSFSPYISGYVDKHPDNEMVSSRFNGGLDLQLGITESFTLDMTLIPDFGQVKSDDKVLNISPYEVQYGEQRPFFNEGMDLFDKGGIFYSRRIGSTPKGYGSVSKQLKENEKITQNPYETAMINATKISGRTSKGLGVGVLNAITSNTYAVILDTIAKRERTALTQGFTNYNMLVLDQTLKNNSYVSLVNTNLYTPASDYMANVSATDFVFRDKQNMYALYGKGMISQIIDDKTDVGYKYNIGFDKTSGNFLFQTWTNTETENYNPNDMGFLQKANEFSNGGSLGYKVYKPFWKLLNWSSWIGGSYRMLYTPRAYTSSHFYISFNTTFAKSYHMVSGEFWMDPHETHDYDEPRVDGFMVVRPRRFSGRISTSSDYRKTLALDTRVSYWRAQSMDMDNLSIRVSPRIRFSNSFFMVYQVQQDFNRNDIGFVAKTNDNSTVYMGLRDVSTLTNTIDATYTFNATSFLSARVRHYWRWLDYSSYHSLNNDGTLSAKMENADFDGNINANLFNIDLTYQWNFAPGSVLSIVWKNSIESSDKFVRSRYLDNVEGLLGTAKGNSISIRLLYYLDYNVVAQKLKSKQL